MSSANFASFLAAIAKKTAITEVNKSVTMSQAKDNVSGWRQLGMYISVGMGGPPTNDDNKVVKP